MKKYLSTIILLLIANLILAQNDTIFCLTPPPNIDSCLESSIKKYGIVFQYGTLIKLEKNYKTIKNLENKYGESFIKEMLIDLSCSNQWKKYLKDQIRNSKGHLLSTKYKVKFWKFGIIKSYQSEQLTGSPDVWIKIFRSVKFDVNGQKLKDEKREKKINMS